MKAVISPPTPVIMFNTGLTFCHPPSEPLPSALPGPGWSASGCVSLGWPWEEQSAGTHWSHSVLPGRKVAPRSSPLAVAVLAGLGAHQADRQTRHPPQLASMGTWPCSCPSCPPVGPFENGSVPPPAPSCRSQRSLHSLDEDNLLSVQVPRGHILDRRQCGWPVAWPAAPPCPCPCNGSSTFSPQHSQDFLEKLSTYLWNTPGPRTQAQIFLLLWEPGLNTASSRKLPLTHSSV